MRHATPILACIILVGCTADNPGYVPMDTGAVHGDGTEDSRRDGGVTDKRPTPTLIMLDPAGGKCYNQNITHGYGTNFPAESWPVVIINEKIYPIHGEPAGANRVKIRMPLDVNNCGTIKLALDFAGVRTNALTYTYIKP